MLHNTCIHFKFIFTIYLLKFFLLLYILTLSQHNFIYKVSIGLFRIVINLQVRTSKKKTDTNKCINQKYVPKFDWFDPNVLTWD